MNVNDKNMMTNCELCQQLGGEVIWQDARCRVVLVADADYLGFCRVIWQAHIKEMTDLPPLDRQHLMMTVMKVETAVRAVLNPDKINLASLGNLTPHLHWHVIPRFAHDKHFPQPIWGQAQRTSQHHLPAHWRAELTAHLTAILNASC